MPGMALEWFGEPWGDLELVSLNPDLGDYFGTKEGILVVKAPADSTLPLKGGDVILSIGGREPPTQTPPTGILRVYEPGGTVALDNLRHEERMALTGEGAGAGGRPMRLPMGT